MSYTQVAAPLGFISAHAGKQTVHLMLLRWVSSTGGFISSWSSGFFLSFLWGGSKWGFGGEARSEMNASVSQNDIVFSLPRRMLIRWSRVPFFFSPSPSACLGHCWRLFHFSARIQEWPKLDLDGRTVKQHLFCTSCWHIMILSFSLQIFQKKQQKTNK